MCCHVNWWTEIDTCNLDENDKAYGDRMKVIRIQSF
jgi:hypothetical protein